VITETPHDDTKNEFGIKAYNLRLPTIDSRLHCHCEGEPKPRARRRGSDVANSINPTNSMNATTVKILRYLGSDES
jgi:hypothetical protein